MSTNEDGHIIITYGIAPNERGEEHGFLPCVTVNGRRRGNTWAWRGYDADLALELAKHEAGEEASRFVGDWDITVRPAEGTTLSAPSASRGS